MGPKKRTCLRCQKPFNSRGPENRICNACTLKNNREQVMPSYKQDPDNPFVWKSSNS